MPTINELSTTITADGRMPSDTLKSIPTAFAEQFSDEDVRRLVDEHLACIRGQCQFRYATAAERDAVPEAERARLGATVFDEIVASIDVSSLNRFERFLFWFSDWWYYHHALRLRVVMRDMQAITERGTSVLGATLESVLPRSVREVVGHMRFATVAIRNGHFAMLFIDEERRVRRIITDTQAFELRGVFGYIYLDCTDDGLPVARSRCGRGGHRAFFDGVRLMSHDRLQTCAPKTIIIDGGYKVNSTHCTIVNGALFPLIDADDAVAHTNGAFFGICDFSVLEHLDASALAEQSGRRMCADGQRVTLDGQELQPIGTFAPSATELLPNGFTLVQWSEFREFRDPTQARFRRVLAVDDQSAWLETVRAELQGVVAELECCCTTRADDALATILAKQPNAVILDMHLTPDERFDGLWIANQLAQKGFRGAILLASSYGDDALRAMQRLIRCPVEIPGKNIARIRAILLGKRED